MSTTGTVKVLLAGTGTTANKQHHQAAMYLPAVQSLDGFEIAGLWAPDRPEDNTAGSRAAELARGADIALFSDLSAAVAGGISLIIACPDPARPPELATLLERAAGAQIPVLIDKPTLLGTADLIDLAQRFPGAIAAHHPRFHPALTATRGRVAGGGLGLLHAIHGELLVGPSDGPHPAGELRNLAVYALDVVQSLIGDLHGKAHAVIAPPGPDGCGESITLSLRCEQVVVSLLVGRSGGSTPAPRTDATPLPANDADYTLHRYRILGSHGQLLVDLDSPAFDLYGAGHRRLPFGPSSVQAMIQSVAAGGRVPNLAVAAGLAAIIDVLTEAAAHHRVTQF